MRPKKIYQQEGWEAWGVAQSNYLNMRVSSAKEIYNHNIPNY